MSTTNHIRNAENRAKVSAFLKSNLGKHSVSEIAHLLGVSGKSAGQLLAGMSRNHLLPQPAKHGKEWYYWWDEVKVEKPATEPEEKRVYRQRSPAMGDEMTIEILGAVAVYKRGYISEEQMIAAITSIVKGKSK